MKLKKGYTLAHEHMIIDLSAVKGSDDCNLNCFSETVKELKQLYDSGVRNIIDMTCLGMGRDLQYIKNLQQEVDINIILPTGFYKEPFLPVDVYSKSIEELADILIEEITEGIADSGLKANIIAEIGTSKNNWTTLEKKIFEAAVIAHKKTGVPISTHTSLGTLIEQQTDFFIANDIAAEKVVIGHTDLSGDILAIKQAINKGFYVGFDTIGKNNYFPDEKRVEFLKILQDEGLLNRVLLSMDITRKSNLKYQGGIGYNYLFEVFVPMLKEAGITDQSIELMLVENPMRLFSE
ncbi:MAG: phosphotriesterase [Erysipelotrichaceae bacterium]